MTLQPLTATPFTLLAVSFLAYTCHFNREAAGLAGLACAVACAACTWPQLPIHGSPPHTLTLLTPYLHTPTRHLQ